MRATGAAVLDLGCGVGSVGLCLAWRRPDLGITGLDREPVFVAARAPMPHAMASQIACTILEATCALRCRGSSTRVAMNPPYLKAGTATVSAHPLKAAATAESVGEARRLDRRRPRRAEARRHA